MVSRPTELGEALDRWELSLVQDEPFRFGTGLRPCGPASFFAAKAVAG